VDVWGYPGEDDVLIKTNSRPHFVSSGHHTNELIAMVRWDFLPTGHFVTSQSIGYFRNPSGLFPFIFI
jgi:hypothetical protein